MRFLADMGISPKVVALLREQNHLFRLNNASREVMETRLQEVIKICSLDLLEGAIISVSNDSFRVRCLRAYLNFGGGD